MEGGGESVSSSASPCNRQCIHMCMAELQLGAQLRAARSSAASQGTVVLRAHFARGFCTPAAFVALIQPPPTGACSCREPPGCTPVAAAHTEPCTLHAASCTPCTPPWARCVLCIVVHRARHGALHVAAPHHPAAAALAPELRPRDKWELSAAPCLLLTFGNATPPQAAPAGIVAQHLQLISQR